MSFRVSAPRRARWLGSQDFDIHDRPYAPHPYDDEFDNGINPAWLPSQWANQRDFVNNLDPYAGFATGGVRIAADGDSVQPVVRRSWLRGQNDNQGGFWYYRRPIPDLAALNEWVVYARMSFTVKDTQSQTDNDSTVGIGIFGPNDFNNCVLGQINEGDANELSIECGVFNGGVFTIIGSETNNVGGIGTVEGQHAHTVAIQRLGATTFHVWTMSAAGNWLWIGTGSYTGGVHAVGIFGRNTLTAGNSIQGFDYVRFKLGRFLP